MAGYRDCADCRCWSVGIRNLFTRQGPQEPEHGDSTSGPDRSLGGAAVTSYALPGGHPSWQRRAIHYLTDLLPHKRLFKEMVFRYWSAREERTIACCNRNAGSRSATPASAQ